MFSFYDLFKCELKNNVGVENITDEFFALLLKQKQKETKENILIVTPTLYEANKLYNHLSNNTDNIHLFPMDDLITTEAIGVSPDFMIERLLVINKLIECEKNNIVITHLEGYLRFLPTKENYKNHILNIKVNKKLNREDLITKLYNLGYTKETLVSKVGEFGIRGFIIDLFSINYEYPIRLEFFDDEIESIRMFDPVSQKSIKNLEEVFIMPYTEFITDKEILEKEKKQSNYNKYEQVNSILDFMKDALVIYKDYNQLLNTYKRMLEQIVEYNTTNDYKYIFDFNEVTSNKVVYLSTLDNQIDNKLVKEVINFEVREVPNFGENFNALNSYILKSLSSNKTVVLSLDNTNIEFSNILNIPFILTDLNNLYLNKLNIVKSDFDGGFECRDFVFITKKEIYKEVRNKKTRRYYQNTTKLKDIEKLVVGDYVVHDIHGIGIYNGIKTLSKNGIKKDYIEVLYLKNDKLYIPVNKIEYLSKYSGKEGARPKISKLGGSDFEKVKQRVREKIRDVASKILKIQAERKLQEGFKFDVDSPLQQIFESEFEYELTKDQQSCLEEIKHDMESKIPMDRILCGDVGYGKTEVAFRAMFKAVMNSKQVLYLCPTTLLSKQQYENAISRFKNFPVNIALLNRFTPLKKVKETLKKLENQEIDILFGTHRILSNDIKPKDLGLLVVDEEQRFGVMHKERIKEYKANVDVLTLTATPIPRTLQMAMVGIRNLSLIETPPKNRHAIQTYVIPESDMVIRDVIYKELSRNGQIYVLYNNVSDIEYQKMRLNRLVKEARVTIAHGQMDKNVLENTMIDFVEKKYDILLCTTIIETGIDISNVNTLIILDADRYGLSQLYQIRGRVGRSDKIAYAYLMYNGNKSLTETAIKRLKVIKEFTELGSGFSIATRDLSIRGAGDILGSEQAGFIDAVGIELYLKLLNAEVEKLKGNYIEKDENSQKINEKLMLEVNTHIEDSYISDTDLKIEIHKKINSINSLETLEKVKEEIEDRFGKINDNLYIYMCEEWFEKLASFLEVVNIIQNDKYIELVFSEAISKNINYEHLFISSLKITSNFKFKYVNDRLIVTLTLFGLKQSPVMYLIKLLSSIKLAIK